MAAEKYQHFFACWLPAVMNRKVISWHVWYSGSETWVCIRISPYWRAFKNRLQGPTPRVSDSVGLGGTWKYAFLKGNSWWESLCNKLYREVKLGVCYVLDINSGDGTLKIKTEPLTCISKLSSCFSTQVLSLGIVTSKSSWRHSGCRIPPLGLGLEKRNKAEWV